MKVRLAKIGTGEHMQAIEREYQIAYRYVRVMRYKNTDVITQCTEEEAITVARWLDSGYLRYSAEHDNYQINGCSYLERDPERNVAICYPTWTENQTEHVFFGIPTMFPWPHFEQDDDEHQRFIFSNAGTPSIMTKEVDFR